MSAVLITWAVCATGLYGLAEIWRAGERRERARIEAQLTDARADLLRVRRCLDIAAESQFLTVTRDESGQYHFRVVPRAEAREVTCTITVNAPGGAA